MRIPVPAHLRHGLSFYDVSSVRQMDVSEIARLGDGGGYALMSRAGQSAFALLRQRWPGATKIAVLCGGGNNGGDGWVVALLAQRAGMQVRVYSPVDPQHLKGDAHRACQAALAEGVSVLVSEAWPDEQPDVWVDALVGIGFEGQPRGALAEWCQQVNASEAPVLALDVPSGVNAATGHVQGVAVKARVTLSFIALKPGLLTGAGLEHCGELWLDDLDVSADTLASRVPMGRLLSLPEHWATLPPRQRDAHKGAFGRCLVVGGDFGYGGAAILAAGSASRSGSGGVICATRDAHVQPGLSCLPDVMFRAVNSRDELLPVLDSVDAVALGPGLGQKAWGQMVFQGLMACGKPMVLDADALNLLARGDSRPALADCVLTPHPGEAARLLGISAAAVNADRVAAACEIANRWQAICLLKGGGTVIASPQHASVTPSLAIVRGGNPGMATAGMGDVLTGLIGGLLAQGLPAFEATCMAASWHARSGDLCADQNGEVVLMASDVCGSLSAVFEEAVLA